MRLARHAWSLVVLTAALGVAQAFLLRAAGVPLVSAVAVGDAFPGATLATVVGSLVGAVILSRHPRHPIGWLFCLGQVGVAAGLCARAAGDAALAGGLPVSPEAARIAEWLGDLLGSMFALVLLAVLLLLAPDGRLPSPRWRPALVVPLASYAALVAILLVLAPPSRLGAGGRVPGGAAPALLMVSEAGIFAGLVLGAVALVVRLRRAEGEQRQQVRWIALAAVGLATVPVVALVLNLAGRPTPLWIELALHAAYLAVPVATGFAVLRYRLYDVDRVIGGAVVLAVLLVFAAAGYLVAVASVGRAVEGRDRPSWLALAAFVVVVLALQPVRRVASGVADRLVYGPRAARYAVLVAHSHHLADAATSESFLTGVAETTARLMSAASCRAAVVLAGGGEVGAVWPPHAPAPAAGTGVEVPVLHEGAHVGRLVLDLPRQAAPSPSRRRVLREFCEQAGPAFRTTGLEGSLRAGAVRLAQVNGELAGSRRRLLAAQDSGRLQVATAIRVAVVRGLREVPERLSVVPALAARDPAAAAALVDECVAATAEALDQLRDITRAINPPLLAQRGLYAALLARRPPPDAAVDVLLGTPGVRRWPPDIEACAYFCCTDLLRGARGRVRVLMESDDDELALELTFEPDGEGPTAAQLEGTADRVEALGGELLHRGREVRLTFPVTPAPRRGPPASIATAR